MAMQMGGALSPPAGIYCLILLQTLAIKVVTLHEFERRVGWAAGYRVSL